MLARVWLRTNLLKLWTGFRANFGVLFIALITIALVAGGVLSEAVRSFIALLPVVLTWPVCLLILVLYLGSSTTAASRISNVFGRFGSLKFLGSEVTFTTEGARQLFSNAAEAFDDFKHQADREFGRQMGAQGLHESLGRIFRSTDSGTGDDLSYLRHKKGFRCTVHIEDILFKDTLYQLVDYYQSARWRWPSILSQIRHDRPYLENGSA